MERWIEFRKRGGGAGVEGGGWMVEGGGCRMEDCRSQGLVRRSSAPAACLPAHSKAALETATPAIAVVGWFEEGESC